MPLHTVTASCFATLSDLAAFRHAKALGMRDEEAFAHGDNGIGYWGDNTAQTHTAMCAIIPEDMIAEWGSVSAAKHQRVLVVYGKHSVDCLVADTMPHRKYVKNGAGIDLNPAAILSLGFDADASIMIPVQWGRIENATAV